MLITQDKLFLRHLCLLIYIGSITSGLGPVYKEGGLPY